MILQQGAEVLAQESECSARTYHGLLAPRRGIVEAFEASWLWSLCVRG